MKPRLLLAAAVLYGLLVAYIDTRPSWDDSGITGLALLIGSGLAGWLAGKRPWLFALAIGIWLPAWYVFTTQNLSMILLLVFPFVGAYVGWGLRSGYEKMHQPG